MKFEQFDLSYKKKLLYTAIKEHSSKNNLNNREIAIIGISGYFPRSKNTNVLWDNLKNGKNLITEIPSDRFEYKNRFEHDRYAANKIFCKWGGFIDDVYGCDPLFFNIAPSEAENIDPQERLLLEVLWHLHEDAGYTRFNLCSDRKKIGLYVGVMYGEYQLYTVEERIKNNYISAKSPYWSIANRASYFFNFQGPSIAIDTACSSSLTALYFAVSSLQTGHCKVAIAAGVNLNLHLNKYYQICEGGFASFDGQCRSFSEHADGYVPGEAIVAVLLKPLWNAIIDGDNIYGTIKSVCINHSGKTNGYMVPNPRPQAELIANAIKTADVDVNAISYVEAAANGSVFGDSVEIAGLCYAFNNFTANKHFCAIGSLKPNLGHLEAASGLTQLIKVLLQFKYKLIPPTINIGTSSSKFDLSSSPFFVHQDLSSWDDEDSPRLACINSFGAGGSNACVIVQECSLIFSLDHKENFTEPFLFLLSAKSIVSLRKLVNEYIYHIENKYREFKAYRLADIIYTIQVGREHLKYRLAIQIRSLEALVEKFKEFLANERSCYTEDIFFTSDVDSQIEPANLNENINEFLRCQRWQKIAEMWVNGMEIPWHSLYKKRQYQKVPLILYPFEDRICKFADIFEGEIDKAQNLKVARTDIDVTALLTQTIAQILKIDQDDLSIDSVLSDFGVDSILYIKILNRITQHFNKKIDFTKLVKCKNIREIADELKKFVAEEKPHKLNEDAVIKSDRGLDISLSNCHPLSYSQSSIFYSHSLHDDKSAYNIGMAFFIAYTTDFKILNLAIRNVIKQHLAFNVKFGIGNGYLFQRYVSDVIIDVDVEKIACRYDSVDFENKFNDFCNVNFDLFTGNLLKIKIWKFLQDTYTLGFVLHHIIFDGASSIIFLEDLQREYKRLSNNKSYLNECIDIRYITYVNWETKNVKANKEFLLKYWLRKLNDAQFEITIKGKESQNFLNYKNVCYRTKLDVKCFLQMKEFCKKNHISKTVLLLTAYRILLSLIVNKNDFLIAIPTLGRYLPDQEEVIGCFINILPLRIDFDVNLTNKQLIENVNQNLCELIAHQQIPFALLVENLLHNRSPYIFPLTQICFEYQNWSHQIVESIFNDVNSGLNIEPILTVNKNSDFLITLEVTEYKDDLLIAVYYRNTYFSRIEIENLFSDYEKQILYLIGNPDHLVKNSGFKEVPNLDINDHEANIVSLFHEVAAANTNKIAAICSEDFISYGDLDKQTSALADKICHHIPSNKLIGILLERSLNMLVTLMGILKAGCAYVPLDPAYPNERLNQMIVDARIEMIITSAAHVKKLGVFNGQKMLIDAANFPEEMLQIEEQILSSDLAYVIFTSGSSGKPKGVMITHRNVICCLSGIAKAISWVKNDRLLAVSSICFDISVLELFLPLLFGGTVVIAKSMEVNNADALKKLISDQKITVMQATPATWQMLVDTDWLGKKDLKIISGGDNLLDPLAQKLLSCGQSVWNAYGPTETTIWSTTFLVKSNEPVKIGIPLPGYKIAILDDELKPVSIDVIGELYIGGLGVAKGYLNNDELTNQRFLRITNRNNLGEIFYRTGDLVKQTADGNLVFVGRSDSQIKLRGYRIELKEIENAIIKIRGIKHAVADVKDKNTINARLCVWLVIDQTYHAFLKRKSIEKWLSKILPEYMMPGEYIFIDKMPLTENGKVNRKSLINLSYNVLYDEQPVNKNDDAKDVIRNIWKEILQVDNIEDDRNFFEIGGNSLLLNIILYKLQALNGIYDFSKLKLFDLFRYPTIATLAQYLIAEEKVSDNAPVEASKVALTRKQLRKKSKSIETKNE